MTDPTPLTLVRIKDAVVPTGYTEKAIRKKIERGVWLDGYEYHRAPDGRIVINLQGVVIWLQGKRRIGRPGVAG